MAEKRLPESLRQGQQYVLLWVGSVGKFKFFPFSAVGLLCCRTPKERRGESCPCGVKAGPGEDSDAESQGLTARGEEGR